MPESEDNDLDLSEADFAPAHCSGFLQPCSMNGDGFHNAAVDTAISDVMFPVHNESHVMDDNKGVLSSHRNVTSSSMQNTEASSSASVHYDAIGLPLCTESLPSDKIVTCQNSVLSEAAESSNDHVVKNNLDSDVVSSNNAVHDTPVTRDGISMALSVSSVNSASPSVAVSTSTYEDGKHLDSCLGTDGNTTCEDSDAVELPPKIADDDVDSRINFLDELEYTVGSSEQPNQQSSETANSDVTDSAALDELSDMPIPSVQDVITSQAINSVHVEEVSVACGDSFVIELSPVVTGETDDLDGGIDEVDKTVSYLHQVYSNTTSRDKHFKAGVPFEDHDHLLDSKKKSADLASGDSSWVEKEFDETCGIDHVEIITSRSALKSKAKVKVDSCAVLKCTLASDIVVRADGASEVAAVCEMVNCDKDAVTSRVPVQPDVQLLLDTDHSAASSPCSAPTAEVTGSDFLQLQEIPVDIADGRMYDVPEAAESLQKHVSEDTFVSHVGLESGEVRDGMQSSSVNNAGDDLENTDLHRKPPNNDGGSSLTAVINDSIALDAEPSSHVNESMPIKEFPGDEKDEGLETLSYATASVAPCMQEVDLSTLNETDSEQEKYGVNSSIAGQIDASVSSDTLPIAHAFDIGPFNAGMGDDISTDIDSSEKGNTVVYAQTEGQIPSTDCSPSHQFTDGAPSENHQQSAEDAERWFEEQFAACEDFDVDEFVSSAWSTFRLDSAPAVSNVDSEIPEQTSAGNGHEPVQLDTADAWHYVENAAVAGSAVDDSYQQPSSYAEDFDSEMEPTVCYPPSSSDSEVTDTFPSLPGIY